VKDGLIVDFGADRETERIRLGKKVEEDAGEEKK